MTKPTLLLTGASGVLGRALIEELARDHHIVGLRHRATVDDPRVEELAARLDAPDLGLGEAGFADLAGKVDVVLHSAARTDWRASREDLFAVNVTGTEHMLGLARAADVPFYYVSTAFVARPQAEEHREIGPAAYVDSKIAAEAAVRADGHPAAIVRPSVVGGDSHTGHIASFQGMHKVLGAVVKGSIPVIPADAQSPFDVIPQDVVARGVGRLIREGRHTGDYWLTAGRNSPNLGEYVDLVLAVARRLGHTEQHRPRMMPSEVMHRLLLPLMEDLIPRSLRLQFKGFLEMLLLFQSASTMESSFESLGMGEDVSHASLLAAFERSIEYWIRTKMPARVLT